MSKSEAVVIEAIEVRELLRFLFYLDILNKLSLPQRKHSKYMYAKCLNFPCFITYLAACMHAFCMFYLYVSLGNRSENITQYLLNEFEQNHVHRGINQGQLNLKGDCKHIFTKKSPIKSEQNRILEHERRMEEKKLIKEFGKKSISESSISVCFEFPFEKKVC